MAKPLKQNASCVYFRPARKGTQWVLPCSQSKEEELLGRGWVTAAARRKGGQVPTASKGRGARSWPGPQRWPRGRRVCVPTLQGDRGLGIPSLDFSSLCHVVTARTFPDGVSQNPGMVSHTGQQSLIRKYLRARHLGAQHFIRITVLKLHNHLRR